MNLPARGATACLLVAIAVQCSPNAPVQEAASSRVDGGASPSDAGTADATSDPPNRPDASPLDKHTVISQSASSTAEAETSIAIAPDGTLAAVWISIASSSGVQTTDIGYVFTHDGGVTWTAPVVMRDATGRQSSDPVVAADAHGNFYATWIAYRRSPGGASSDFVIYVAKAKAGADAFGAPTVIDTFSSGDKPWIAVTAAGSILVTYMTTVGSTSTLHVQRSTDDLSSFTDTILYTSPGGESANFLAACASKTSTGRRVWAMHKAVEATVSGQRLHWSDDDGSTWPAENTTLFAQGSALQAAACVARGQDVWVAYGQWTHPPRGPDAPVDEYHVMHTTNGYAMEDVVASDAATAQQSLGALAVDDATGEVALTYYAGDATGASGTVRSVRSTDGRKWGKSAAVSAPLVFTDDRSTPKWLGDYPGTVLRGGVLFTVYGENADASTHIAFTKTP
jgi:hypothetical protein